MENKKTMTPLPCPFCGGDAFIEKGSVECTSCCAKIDKEFSSQEDEAIAAWNRRVVNPLLAHAKEMDEIAYAALSEFPLSPDRETWLMDRKQEYAECHKSLAKYEKEKP